MRSGTTPAGQLAEAKLHCVLGYQVAQASVSTLRVFEQLVGRPLELRPIECTMLMLICDNPGVAPCRLAEALAVTAPNITTWIDKLEHRGLVRRGKSETDGRAQQLRATAKGQQLATKATTRLLEGEREAFAGLTLGESQILIELLHKVAAFRPK
jgi:DNA-binding MarR family transcriptional regulator